MAFNAIVKKKITASELTSFFFKETVCFLWGILYGQEAALSDRKFVRGDSISNCYLHAM